MGFRTVLLAWLDGRQRLCREGDANMGWRQAGFGAPCWRGPPVANEGRMVSPSHAK